jgi:acyl-CoA synthetase (AMP-forming)/AMP-acid ligase II
MHAFLVQPTFGRMAELNAHGGFELSSLRTDTPSAKRPGGYGLVVASGMLTLRAYGGTGGHGLPHPGLELRILRPDGAEAEPGEVGEIAARGGTITLGYHNRPEINAARSRDGWWPMDDLGVLDPDGSLTFVGAMSRLIKSAGENIHPVEVEACLRSHRAVLEAAVIGIPDPVWKQSVKALVVLHDGSQVSAEELIEHFRSRLASFKKPRLVEFRPALPKGPSGVDYAALDARFGGGGYPGASRGVS